MEERSERSECRDETRNDQRERMGEEAKRRVSFHPVPVVHLPSYLGSFTPFTKTMKRDIRTEESSD